MDQHKFAYITKKREKLLDTTIRSIIIIYMHRTIIIRVKSWRVTRRERDRSPRSELDENTVQFVNIYGQKCKFRFEFLF